MSTRYKKKPSIFLDLDNTLICSETFEEYDDKDPKIRKKTKKFRNKKMDDCYIVFERPGLQSFLSFLFKNFKVSVWTAASKDYALFVIDKIILNDKKNRQIDWIFFSYHCDISNSIKKGTKDLNIIWDDYKIDGYCKNTTVILDDYDEVYKTQPNNCILVSPFKFTDDESEADIHLLEIKSSLENMIKDIKNGKEKPASDVNKKLKVVK
jgi:TFIIF-interacting CTD phosphatase-like protein